MTTALQGALGKVAHRLLPWLFVLYVVAYLDRINVGFAALTMVPQLGLTSEQYGLLAGIFFLGYFLLEIPSNLIMHRVGARVWIARILITWGVISLLTGFVSSAMQLYVARFLLGAAEAGFFPGIILYLTYWFPQRRQAAAIGKTLTALPTASVLGGPLSGWLLDHVHWLGLASWRWLFVIEAIPAIVCGLATFRLLPSRPSEARFLHASERAEIEQMITAESRTKRGAVPMSTLATLRDPTALWLAACVFLYQIGLYTLGFWMPLALKGLAHGASNTFIGGLVLIPNLLGLVAMIVVGKRSDRCGERHLHAAIPLAIAALALLLVGHVSSLPIALMLWSAVAIGLCGFTPPFWALPGGFLTGRSAAAGIALISSIGSLGGFVGLTTVGWLAARTGSLGGGFAFVGAALLLSVMLILTLRVRARREVQPAIARV